VKIPSWAPVAARILLAIGGIYLGVNMLLDGFSGEVLALASGILIAELVGAGLTKNQAQELEAKLEQLLASSPGAAAATPPPKTP
jgi:hypothetical protein